MGPSTYAPPAQPFNVRPLQIIVLALALGVTAFMGLVVWMIFGQGKPPLAVPAGGMLWPIALAVAGGCVVASLFVPRVIQAAGVKKISDEALASRVGMQAGTPGELYQRTTIIGAALLEGAAFFNLIAYMSEGAGPSLLAALLLLAGILSHFPTQGRFNAWCDKLAQRRRDTAALGDMSSR